METITVELSGRSYPVHVGQGLLDRAGTLIRDSLGAKARKAVLISNQTVDRLYGHRTSSSLRRGGFRVERVLIGDGERYKTLRTAEMVYTSLIERGIERSDVIVAVGGGVVGDLAGFVGATFLRGIRLVHVPTTLLAQIDSSIGGKTGVNHRLGKNLIGAFHQPALVMVDIETLGSLPVRQINAGLFEAVKYGVIRDRGLFERIGDRADLIRRLDPTEIAELVARCCQIKADVVARDERESGLRKILNFGHTVGHALEAVTDYRRFLHGEAVGHGMRVAARIAERTGLLSSVEREAIDWAVARVGRLPSATNLALSGIMSAIGRDKKAEGGQLAFVLPVEIGKVVIKSEVPLQAVRSALKDALSL
jgi:3-dehydroquinate synthase